jgi:hypothetical protein
VAADGPTLAVSIYTAFNRRAGEYMHCMHACDVLIAAAGSPITAFHLKPFC